MSRYWGKWDIAIVRLRKGVKLLRENRDMAILKVRKDVTLLRENRNMAILKERKNVRYRGKKWTWL